ncbi:anoctamin-7 isoform X1 [Cololabis saira]|uniref:anoctamin-7 isoform X1 n=1 Tax=Cololabis saira TaxID=129043 RepID=UPI002AD463EE|nr:anoctamin-7 isoform X1 [Cololabis saira]
MKVGRMTRRGEQQEGNTTLIAMETSPGSSYGSIATNAPGHVSVSQNAPGRPRDRNVFSDGTTRVDFVLVWEEPRGVQEAGSGVSAAHVRWREEFLSRLGRAGLLQEKQVLQRKTRTVFVLLSAPWSLLCFYAEEIRLRVPLQEVRAPMENWSQQALARLGVSSPLAQDVPAPPPYFYTCPFRASKLQRFLGSDDTHNFFKTTQRHQVLYEILARTPYGSVPKGEVGIDRLVSEQVFTAAYPLHEGGFRPPVSPGVPASLGLRQILYLYWARWSRWRFYQPLDHIREYFGEKIALYFAWIGFYTGWLLPASLIGTLVFLVGFWLVATDVPAKEVCESEDAFIMCPICNICSHWNYSSICITYKAGLLFDNGGTVFLSVFMSLWAVTFLEYWKRTSSSLSHRWDCSDFQDIEERPRPEFTAMAPMTLRNPVTGEEEPHFPDNKRLNRTVTGCMVIIIMVAVVLIFLIAIIFYRTILSIIIYKSEYSFFSFSVRIIYSIKLKPQRLRVASLRDATPSRFCCVFQAGRIASLSGSVLNLLVILMLSRVYITLAHVLTRWEMHRTQTKYEDMFILKVFIFQFVNFYSSPVYIAFFKGRFVGYPGNYDTLFGVRNEDCGAGGCLIELAQEMLVIMVGKQLINNIQEFISPKLKSWWQKRRLRPHLKEKREQQQEEEEEQEEDQASPWESDYQLLVCEGLFSEYLEMVLQFGFITIFVAACPLAPLFALVNNWVEIRLDAQKFVTEFRRPVVERATGIGVWFSILQFITHTAVLSNAFLIAFTSSFVPRLYYRYTRDASLSGFTNFTLATSPTRYNQQHNGSCRYRGFRDQDGRYLPEYFHLLAVRLTFVIVFQHVVFFIGRLIDMMVPDVPEEVEIKMKREHYMAKQALAENQSLGRIWADTDQGDLRQRGSRTEPDLGKIPEETGLGKIPEEPGLGKIPEEPDPGQAGSC